MTVSRLNRAAIFTLSASVLRRLFKSCSVHPPFSNSSNTKRRAFCSSVWVRTGVIGNKRTGVMGYSSEHYVLENCEPYGRDYSICDVGAERAIYREGTVRAVRDQPQDRL